MEKHTVHLLLETITTLQNIISSTDPSTLINRNARIILACNRSSYGKEYQLDIDSVCDKFNLSKQTIMNIQKNFCSKGIASLTPKRNKKRCNKSVSSVTNNFFLVGNDGGEFLKNFFTGKLDAVHPDEKLNIYCNKIL